MADPVPEQSSLHGDLSRVNDTTELLKEINDLKRFVMDDNRNMKEMQLNIMKDLQNQNEIMESNQQRLETDLQDLQEENKGLNGVLQDMNSLSENATQSLKEDLQNLQTLIDSNHQSLKTDLQDLQEENKALKGILEDMNCLSENATQSLKEDLQDLHEEKKALNGVLQDMNRLSGNATQSLKEDIKDLQEEYYQNISQNQEELIDHIQGLTTDFLNVLEEFKSSKNFTQSQDEQIQQCPTTDPVPPTSTPSTISEPVSPTSTPSSKDGSSSTTDCSDIFAGGQSKSGTYEIFLTRNQRNKSLEVFCDMEDGGSWTVFLLRDAAAKHVDFHRNWNAYKEFFGNVGQEYWIGNENLHALTSHRNYEVKFEAKDEEGRSTWQGWNSFSVASDENGYRLTLGGYDQRSTFIEDRALGYNNGWKFSTFDNDNDRLGVNCAERSKGGWWYTWCSHIYPMGIHGNKYPEGVSVDLWSKKDDNRRYLRWIQFKIRPTN